MKRYARNLSHNVTATVNMGLCYPSDVVEVFPGDTFRISAKNLTRFLPQVSPTMADVFVGLDTYSVSLRQLCDKIGINWDDYLTGGDDGTLNIPAPTITIPETGYDPGGLADWLGYPTNFTDPDTGQKVIIAAGQKLNAWPVLAYMLIIQENYRDPNFVKKFDFTKYQEFLDGTYEFEDVAGNKLGYSLGKAGVFPKAWSRDYFGRALSNTQRGPVASLPISGSATMQPGTAPLITLPMSCTYNGDTKYYWLRDGDVDAANKNSWTVTTSPDAVSGYHYVGQVNKGAVYGSGMTKLGYTGQVLVSELRIAVTENSAVVGSYWGDQAHPIDTLTSDCSFKQSQQVADLSGVSTNLESATAANILAFRLAARMQRFGEILQDCGARAVEYTLRMFGVRIPDGRVQRPIFHGSWRLPVVFSEVMQTSQTSDTSPQGNLAGHGITGGVNRPLHIKVIEHGFIITIMHVMPRSQFQNITPKYLLRFNRWDIPNPTFQNIGDQALLRREIFPNSANPDDPFGYIPRFSELSSIPSVLRGHMKDTFLHWTMARMYKSEPVLSAKWRYEQPTDRSFAVKDEDQIQLSIGFEIRARRVFQTNPQPGIKYV